MSGAFSIKMDLPAFDAMVDADIQRFEAAARPAAQAGAQVIYEEVKRNVDRIKKHSGNLASSIYQAYSKDNSGQGRATYHVSWNARKAPHGHLVEFGHLQRYEISFDPVTRRFITHKDRPLAQPKLVAAKPFIRPAMARIPEAERAIRAEFDRFVQEGAR